MLTRLLKASDTRKSRLHDEKGHLVPLSRLLAHGPQAAVSCILRLALGLRPQKPWISYAATSRLGEFLDKDKAVLEFGSGMSTLWYAKHAGRVVSIESFRPWYDHVSNLIVQQGLTNVEYHFAATDDDYVSIPGTDGGFDLIMVDGSIRDRCTSVALGLLRPGGIFYLDNSDRMAQPDSPEARAGEMAIAYAKENGCSISYYTDFAPTQCFAQEGMLVHRPA